MKDAPCGGNCCICDLAVHRFLEGGKIYCRANLESYNSSVHFIMYYGGYTLGLCY